MRGRSVASHEHKERDWGDPKGKVPLTEAEWTEKLKQVVPQGALQSDNYDWLAIFTEWIRSSPAEFPSLEKFRAKKKLGAGCFQLRGGCKFWLRARRDVARQALPLAIAKSVDFVAGRYEKELEATSTLVGLVIQQAKELAASTKPGPNGEKPEPNPYMAQAIKTLAESAKLLAETNMKLLGDAKEIAQGGTVNVNFDLHSALVDAVRKRDKEHGVIDVTADPG